VTHRTGTGLRLARAALYRAAAGGALVRLSRWPEGVDAEPPAAALAARALQAARPLAEGRTLAIPLQAGGPRGEVFLAEFGGDAGEPDPEAVRVLEIMLDGAAIALANAELLAELLARTEQLEQANAALRSAQAQLVEHERLAAVGELVVGLHDAILNPLSGILGALQVLKADTLGVPERLEALAHAEQASRRIEGVLRRLTTLRRAARTRYVGETTMLDLDVPAGS
jgi:signal transduction histidine kinase